MSEKNIRKGAAFRTRINDGIQRFLDAGLITMWMDEVILSKVRREREALKGKDIGSQLTLIAVTIYTYIKLPATYVSPVMNVDFQ